MAHALTETSRPRPAADALASTHVGPNAAIQLGHALKERLGQHAAERVFAEAGLAPWLVNPPDEMIDQAHVARLFRALFTSLPANVARTIAADAGARTADYLLANRIPRPAQIILRALPARVAARLLLRAIARNAWTFCGSGRFAARSGSPILVKIAENPLAAPGCTWHVAVFEQLFQTLVSPGARVSHSSCCHEGAPACRFEIAIRPD